MSAPIQRLRAHMQRDLLTLTTDMPLLQAITLLLDAGVSGAPVLDGEGNLVGVFTQRDGLRAALSAAYYREWGGVVGDLMSPAPEVLHPDLDLVSAAERFVSSSWRRFPVVEEGRLVGQISRSDVLRALSQQWR